MFEFYQMYVLGFDLLRFLQLNVFFLPSAFDIFCDANDTIRYTFLKKGSNKVHDVS